MVIHFPLVDGSGYLHHSFIFWPLVALTILSRARDLNSGHLARNLMREVGARNHAFIAGFDVYDEWTYSVMGLYIHWSLKTPEKQNTKFDITTTSQNSYIKTIAMPFAIQFTQKNCELRMRRERRERFPRHRRLAIPTRRDACRDR